MHQGVEQKTFGIDEDMALFAFDLLTRIIAMRVNFCPPFFRALDALAIYDGGGRTGFPLSKFETFHVECMVDSIQRAVVVPQVEVIMHRAARRQVFGKRSPLAARA